jgi:hypothetical protein
VPEVLHLLRSVFVHEHSRGCESFLRPNAFWFEEQRMRRLPAVLQLLRERSSLLLPRLLRRFEGDGELAEGVALRVSGDTLHERS